MDSPTLGCSWTYWLSNSWGLLDVEGTLTQTQWYRKWTKCKLSNLARAILTLRYSLAPKVKDSWTLQLLGALELIDSPTLGCSWTHWLSNSWGLLDVEGTLILTHWISQNKWYIRWTKWKLSNLAGEILTLRYSLAPKVNDSWTLQLLGVSVRYSHSDTLE